MYVFPTTFPVVKIDSALLGTPRTGAVHAVVPTPLGEGEGETVGVAVAVGVDVGAPDGAGVGLVPDAPTGATGVPLEVEHPEAIVVPSVATRT